MKVLLLLAKLMERKKSELFKYDAEGDREEKSFDGITHVYEYIDGRFTWRNLIATF